MNLVMTLLMTGMAVAGTTKAPAAGADKDAGNKIYTAKCAGCHGANGKGNPAMAAMFRLPPPSLDLTSAATQGKKDSDLAKVILGGKDKMPSFKGKLTDADAANVAAYLKSLGAPPKPAAKK